MVLKSLKYLASGKRSVVFLASLGRKKVVLKVEKPGIAAKQPLKKEARILKIVNKYKIGPKLIKEGGNFVIVEYVKGIPILEFFKKSKKKKILDAIKDILEQCRILDKLKLNKLEMHRPIKHIIINKKATMIDFERTYKTKKPKNVTQFCQFLMQHKRLLKEKGISIEKQKLISLLRKYKEKQTDANFKMIVSLFLTS